MIKKTQDAYLRKRLIRLIKKQQHAIQKGGNLPEGVGVDRAQRVEVKANLERVLNAILFEEASIKDVDEFFILQALRNADTHIHSHRATTKIVMAIVSDILSDELTNARSEHTIDTFCVRFVPRSELKRRKQQRRVVS